MPITTSDEYVLMWEQRDNYLGLQGVRGLGTNRRASRRSAASATP